MPRLGLGLGHGRRRPFDGGGVSLPVAATPLIWLQEDLGVTVDTDSPSDSVSAWANQGSLGGNFFEADKAEQPRYPSADTIRFQDTGPFRLAASMAKSTYRCLHDGTGGTVLMRFQRLNTTSLGNCVLFSSNDASSSKVGATVYYASATGVLTWRVTDGSSFRINSVSGAVVNDTAAHTLVCRYSLAEATDWSWQIDGSVIQTGNAASPATGDSTTDLTLGDWAVGTGPLEADVGLFIVWDSYLSDADVALMETYAGGY